MIHQLTYTPPLKFITARTTIKTCPRCTLPIAPGEQFINHSTDGDIHRRCLRTGATKQYIGRPK